MNARIKIKSLCALCFGLIWFCSQVFAGTLTVPLGEGRLYNAKNYPFKTVYVADPDTAGLRVESPGVFFITGQAIGTTSLYVLSESGDILVRQTIHVVPNVQKLLGEIDKILPKSKVKLTTLGDKVVLKGCVPSPAVGASIREVVSKFSGGDDNMIDHMNVCEPSQIYMRVKIVELSRGVSRMIGLKSWALLYNNSDFNLAFTSFGTEALTNFANLPLDSTGFNLSAFFEALDDDSLVRILSEPNLTALSGQEATFFAGGSFPILVPQTVGAGINSAINTVVYQPFGVTLNFIPTLLDEDIINLQVKTEVSQVSNENSISIRGTRVPSLTSRRAGTTVQVRSGQSFAIAGLMQDNLRDSITRFPMLGRLPILGPLFSSREFQKDHTELVVIVTPYLVHPVFGKLATPIDGVSEKDLYNASCLPSSTKCHHVAKKERMRYIME